MSNPRSWRHLARVVLELTTPMHIGAGREGERADAEIARDANGLPTIPGSSLAGVLRASLAASYPNGAELAEEIFGFQRMRKSGAMAPADARGSSLTVSWASIHDSNNRPVDGIAEREHLKNDPILQAALSPTIRDHVRISHLGAADARQSPDKGESTGEAGGRGKFDEMAVCTGHRFTFEMELAGDSKSVQNWNLLLDVLRDPALRIGAKTRRGFGAFRIVSISGASLCLDKEEDFASYSKHPAALSEQSPVLKTLDPLPAGRHSGTDVVATLELEPEGYWMFGGGTDPSGFEGDADMAPVRDKRVAWKDGKGELKENVIVIPGSSVKGALAHRVAFHCNRLSGVYADKLDQEKLAEETGSSNEAVLEIFGSVKGKDSGSKGLLMIDDVMMDTEPNSQLVHHVSLDRFTGGAKAGFLFSERPLWGGRISLSIRIAISGGVVSHTSRKALESAIKDLAQGRLQIGAGSGRGLGYFTARDGVKWSDGGNWINGGEK
ncbi:MAG TPA: RAMP superfamily CRISPR-associated protein [Candidatus Fermentibacter daniensis]|nr:RAMP superfamily CRISPR-associated protein [Deltaproteobacteria bacterium]HOZ18595.1 RAMP superfamily CRISPR-associated protein [Candidatus Fermentibacter daniensis]HPH40473.1 RAMP superfamily CRISPR-associated protein [Candidatus Fermentibacter daniensis]